MDFSELSQHTVLIGVVGTIYNLTLSYPSVSLAVIGIEFKTYT